MERGIPANKISVVYDGVPLLDPAKGGSGILAPPPSRDKPAALYELSGVKISFAEDLAADLQTASIFIYLSLSEGLGSGVLLAMSAGVPVIASRIGRNSRDRNHEESGLLVDDRPESAVAAINRLQCDPSFGKILAVRARQRVAEQFSIDNMVRHTLTFYHQVLAC